MIISNDNFWEILKVFFVPDFGKLRKSAPQLERSSFCQPKYSNYLRIFEGKKAGVEGGPDNYRERRPNK